MGHIAGRMCNAGALINVQEKMTSQGHEASVLCIDTDECESMLDGWKKHSSTPIMCLKCQSQPLDGYGASSDTGGIKSPATLLLIDSSDKGRASSDDNSLEGFTAQQYYFKGSWGQAGKMHI